MVDSFSETTETGGFRNIINSFATVLFGIILIPGGIALLIYNEGRAVHRARALDEGSHAVISTTPDEVNPAQEGRLLHFSGLATTDESLSDPIFGISAPAIRLIREVEMYQWKESKETESRKKIGGGTSKTTKYSYDKVWSDEAIDSDEFRKPEGHSNPSMTYKSESFNANKVTIGAFNLGSSLVGRITASTDIVLGEETTNKLPANSDFGEARVTGNRLYLGSNSESPSIGDYRISFKVVKPQTISVVAGQSGGSLGEYKTESGGTIELLQEGNVGAEAMFKEAQDENTIITWILRVAGFFLITLGAACITAPVVALANVLPFLGDLVGFGTGLFALVVGLTLTAFSIAVGWFAYRPLLSGGLILGTAGLVWLVKRLGGRKKEAAVVVTSAMSRTQGMDASQQPQQPSHL